MTLEALLKKVAEINAVKAQTQNDVIFLEKRKAEILANAEKVADAGDEEEYIRLTDEASKIDRRIYVKQKLINAPLEKEISDGEVAAAWSDHASDYAKTHKQKYAKFEQQRKKLCEMYAELIEDQRQMLLERKKLHEAFALPANVATTIDDRFPFTRLPLAEAKAINGIAGPMPRLHCYGLTFRDFLLLAFYGFNDIDRETVQAWISVIEGNNEIIPEKQYRPKFDSGPITLGLYRGK